MRKFIYSLFFVSSFVFANPPQNPCVAALTAEEASIKADAAYSSYEATVIASIRKGVQSDPDSLGMDSRYMVLTELYFIKEARQAILAVLSQSFTTLGMRSSVSSLSITRENSDLAPMSVDVSSRYVVSAAFDPDAVVLAVVDFNSMGSMSLPYYVLSVALP